MQKLLFEIHKTAGINHLGKLRFHNTRSNNTPTCWFGLSIIESEEFQLEVFKRARIEAFLSNAYDLNYTDKKGDRLNIVNKLQELKLSHKMDSGGFQLMKAKMNGNSSKFPLNPKIVLDKQLEVGCDIGVQLDFPFGPELTKNQKKKRLNETFDNLIILIDLVEEYGCEFHYLPVIHTISDDLDLLKYSIKRLEEIIGTTPNAVGIGSLVPLIKSMKGTKKNGVESFLYSLITLRKILPNSFLHAFGVGGTMAYLAILAGIDSYDSNGWIQKSAYGVIQLPGISDRFLRKEDHNRPYLIKDRKQRNCKGTINEIDIFMKCNCDACLSFHKKNWKDSDWRKKQKAFVGRDYNSKLLRAVHNVSLYQKEIIRIREEIKNDNLLEFIKDRLKFSIYYKYIKFIEHLSDRSLGELNDLSSLIELNIPNYMSRN